MYVCVYISDLNISVSVLYNYLEANAKVPWEDLRYLFGEIMYGGHITGKFIEKRYVSACHRHIELNFKPYYR